ncbi:MAG: DUF3611 family protein [Cyanobacteria bacterium KgW148]|nr:DUF3611 family protein [Cyanobacteria bacterium KgW148]
MNLSPQLAKTIKAFRTLGFVGLWVHGVPGVIAGVLLIFGGFRGGGAETANPGTLPGVAAAWIGWVLILAGFGWNFFYIRWAKQLQGGQRPSRAQTLTQLKIGIGISLGGQVSALLASFAIVGTLAQRALFRTQGAIVADPSRFVEPIDLFTVQASLLIILAHFLGLLISLWLLDGVTRPRED